MTGLITSQHAGGADRAAIHRSSVGVNPGRDGILSALASLTPPPLPVGSEA